jgi:3-dehydroquinate dehydratase/shikimate dehydrogenase
MKSFMIGYGGVRCNPRANRRKSSDEDHRKEGRRMICITGLESSLQDLRGRCARCWAFPLHEIRLDALEESLPSTQALPVHPGKLIVTCRRPSDGGLFEGSETERLRLLQSAIEGGPGWIDLEADLSEEAAEPLLEKARVFGVKILRSLHLLNDQGSGAIRKALDLLSGAKGDGIKLAARVEDLKRLETLFHAPRERPAVLIGMGPAGMLSRALHRRFHSAWTYVSHHPWPDPSGGIPDLSTAVLFDMPVKDDTKLLVLLGGPSILASPGPGTYNRLFRERRFNGIYLPAITECVEDAFRVLLRLGLAGASVTIPHKMRAAEFASDLGESAAAVQAVNTLYRNRDGRWQGENTDIPAIRAVVERLASRPMKNAVILGSGGFARAAAFALTGLGVDTVLLGREVREARETREPREPFKASLPFDAVEQIAFDILVNATPVGLEPGEDPLRPYDVDFAGKVVLDGVITRSPTTLVTRAAAGGAAVAGGLEIWAEQGARQLERFEGPGITPDELARMARRSGGPQSAQPLP